MEEGVIRFVRAQSPQKPFPWEYTTPRITERSLHITGGRGAGGRGGKKAEAGGIEGKSLRNKEGRQHKENTVF